MQLEEYIRLLKAVNKVTKTKKRICILNTHSLLFI